MPDYVLATTNQQHIVVTRRLSYSPPRLRMPAEILLYPDGYDAETLAERLQAAKETEAYLGRICINTLSGRIETGTLIPSPAEVVMTPE